MTRSDFRTFAMESKIWDHPLFSTAFIDLAFEKSILGGTRKGGREVVMEAHKLNGGHTTKSERYFDKLQRVNKIHWNEKKKKSGRTSSLSLSLSTTKNERTQRNAHNNFCIKKFFLFFRLI